jgi:propanol-preferring alcohol dehydrogenase
MRAWQFTGIGEPLRLAEIPAPVPGPGQVTVDVRAAGLCHSDVGFVDGHITWMLEFTPIVLGHEVAGVISAVGDGVEGFAVGDRVGIAGDGLDAPGIVLDGGFGEQCIGKVEQLVPIPDNVSFVQAASGTDAGMTSYHAVRVVGGVTTGTRVGIIGLGGLGLTGARIAAVAGAEVYAAEVDESKHAAGLAAGVTAVVGDAKELAEFELDVIVDFAGFGTTTAAAVEAINPGGRIVQVGLGAADMTISNQSLVSKQLQLVGSLGGKKVDTASVYELMAAGDLEILATEIPFDDIDQGIERLREGGVQGRLVAVLDPA